MREVLASAPSLVRTQVCAVDVADGVPRRVTRGARGVEGVTNGVADYCAMEEMDRYEGFWLAPGGDRVCFEKVDETGVSLLSIPRPCDAGDPGAAEVHRYPFAGVANPSVQLGVQATDGTGEAVWLDLTKAGLGDDTYLARVAWADASTVLAFVQSRDQRTMRLVAYDASTAEARIVLEETNKAWLNLNDCTRWGLEEGEVLIASERDGVNHLYVHSTADGKVLRRLTEGTACVVEELVDVQNGNVYYLGGSVEPSQALERHLHAVPYDGSAPPKRVDRDAGTYVDAAAVSKTGATFLQHSAVDHPVVTELRSETTTILKDAAGAPLVDSLRPPEFFEIPTTDGATNLRGAYYAPDANKYAKPWPTVVSCYGGPQVQFVADKYATMTADLRAQHLRDRGYLVIKVDNRGSKRRGLAFEAAIQNKFGTLEVDDQVAAVEWACLSGMADPARVGIFGWSYGGYLSAMCLAKAPGVFRCAVAGAPVAAWDGYDTHYTERYMGTPDSNAAGYAEGDVCTHVKNVEGALLLVHGLVDENVHFRHTARIAQAMVDAGKAYDLLCFPNERHSPRSEKDRSYQEERVFSFLEKWLK